MGFLAAWSCVALGMSIPLVGSVHDSGGRPVAGASVMLGDTNATRTTDELLGSTTTDAAGKFRLDRDEAMAGRGSFWSPTLWVFAPGYRVAFEEFKRHVPSADEPVKLVLQPGSGTTIQVRRADGQPASGARVQPTRTNLRAPSPPRRLFDRTAIITDAEGRGTIPGFEPGEITILEVTAAGLVSQGLPVRPADPEPKIVTLRPLGRLSVRVTADDLSAIQNWKITATTTPADVSGYAAGTSWDRETTDPLGIAAYRPMAAGRITWTIEAPAGSPYMAEDPTGVVVQPDDLTEVTIPLRRATRVVGTIVEAGTGRPIAGVRVNTRCESAHLSTDDPLTDASGRFTYTTLPGKNNYAFDNRSIPPTVFAPPDRPSPTEFFIPEGTTAYALPPVELRPAALVRGRVIDEAGQPVAGIDVQGTWKAAEFPDRSQYLSSLTDDAGRFTFGGIAPGAELSVSAQIQFRSQSETTRISLPDHPGVGADPLTLHLKTFETFAIRGRVLGPDGRPFAGARVHVLLRSPQDIGLGTEIELTATPDPRTDPEGNFVTPNEVPVGNMYQVQADAPTYTTGFSTWAQPEVRAPLEVRLLQFPGPRTITGRVLDATGEPVAGVEVFQSGDGPTPTRNTTGPDGRFEVSGVAAAPAFLFARSPANRLTGRLLTAADRSVDLVVTRRDQPSPARLVAARRVDRPEDRAIALAFANDAWQGYLDGRHQPQNNNRPSIIEIMATLDPDRIAAMIENQVITAEPKLLDALAMSRIARDPAEARVFLDSLSPPILAARTGLAVFDSWVAVQPKEWSRAILDQVAAQTERIDDLKTRASVLIDLADNWYRLGDRDRGGAAAHAADTLLGPKFESFGFVSPGRLAVALAPVDLSAAIRRLDQETNPSSRQQYAEKLAFVIAANDPAEAKRLLGTIDQDQSRPTDAAAIAVAMASRGNLAEARALVESTQIDPTVRALLPAMAARRLDPSQVEQARAWLGESFDQLAPLAVAPDSGRFQTPVPGPLVAMALLLPVAVDIDPDHALDYYWLTLASRPPHPFDLENRPVLPWTRQHYLNLEALAVLIDPFDQAAAAAIFGPAAARIPPIDDYTWGLGHEAPALFRTAAAFDGATARAMWAALPEDPPLTDPSQRSARPFHHDTKADARLDIARSLGLPTALRPLDALRAMTPSPWARSSPWLDALTP